MTKKSNFKTNAGWALFLDFDGTLVDIAPSQESIHVPEELPALLARGDNALGGALAIVTGRPIETVDAHLAPFRPIIAGGHGAEFHLGHERISLSAWPLPAAIIEVVSSLSRKFEGASIEAKRSSMSIHYRTSGLAPRSNTSYGDR